MTDPQLLSSTLEAIDRLVADLRGATSASATMGIGREPVRLVVDEGRAAAEWTLTIPRAGVATELAIVVVCDVAGRAPDRSPDQADLDNDGSAMPATRTSTATLSRTRRTIVRAWPRTPTATRILTAARRIPRTTSR